VVYGNWLWKMRASYDENIRVLACEEGGNPFLTKIYCRDAFRFLRVLLADKKRKRLLLFAEKCAAF